MKITFGEWLKTQLKERDMTQSELAAKIDVHPPQVSRLISGERTPTSDILVKIADALLLPRETVLAAAGIMQQATEGDEWDRRVQHLLKQFPLEEKKKIVKRLELEAQFYEQQRPVKSTNKTRP
jgi:transcriptional regulator with XRE-family HTH domain